MFGESAEKKRDGKAGGKEQQRQDKSERLSLMSDDSRISKVTVGSKLSNRAIVREVKEDDWKLIGKDKKYNKLYECNICGKKSVAKHNRNTHCCV